MRRRARSEQRELEQRADHEPHTGSRGAQPEHRAQEEGPRAASSSAAAPQPAHQTASVPAAVPAAVTPAPLPSAPSSDPSASANAFPATATPGAADTSPIAVASGSGQSDGTPMMRVGVPTDRDSPGATAKYTLTGAPASAASAQAKKSGARDGAASRFGLLRLPPPPDSYRQAEFLLANPSAVLLSELGRRHYTVEPRNAAGLARVVLPEGAPNAWDVMRDLEVAFPGPTFGLNSIYRPPTYTPYRLQDGSASAGVAPTRHELLALIGWEGKGDLAACAAGVEIGMIDTLVDEGHRLFAGTQIKTVNLALKQDAPAAPHWHATGVLSIMAGLPNGNTPSLIPGARFTAVNVFFTNKEGQLETDTAHLTEALAYLEEKTNVQIVNMSLVGPKDDLVHARIAAMARSGKVFVGAAGNGGPNAAAGYPAAYEEVIAVTAVDGKGGNWDHANRGTYIDVAAPGVQIRTALPGGKDGLVSGTSFAAPFVTAAVAVAYRDSGLEAAVKQGEEPVELKRHVLAQLLSKEQLKIRSPVYGHGVITAPSTCAGSRSWASRVRPQPAAPAPVPAAARSSDPTPTVPGGWHASVQQASLPPKSP
ncbi:MAG TPA: S8 family serine peptidase [Hyphomicrobiaceae bacterium]